MKEIEVGHVYELSNVGEGNLIREPQKIEFMKRVDGVMTHDGTTNEEVLEMLINRLNYLQLKMPCRENAIVITKLEECLMWLNNRTKKRIEQNVETKDMPHK